MYRTSRAVAHTLECPREPPRHAVGHSGLVTQEAWPVHDRVTLDHQRSIGVIRSNWHGHEAQHCGTKPFCAARDANMKPNSANIRDSFMQRFVVREEFASYGFLAIACAGICLLSAGLAALALG